MVAIGQTITIVNKSGKVVSSSKHLVNVFNEAKTAYNERKAEIKANRRDQAAKKLKDKDTLKRLEGLNIDDDDDDDDDASSRRSSRRGSEDGKSTRRKRSRRPPIERGVSDSFYTTDTSPRQRRSPPRPSPLRTDSHHDAPRAGELARRHTDGLDLLPKRASSQLTRRASADDIDMDLAYGDLPPPLPERKYADEIALRHKMSGLQRLLDEANCVQHSVSATIENLQKNPDALAAVALTLAEISNLAAKMAPGALLSLKSAFPAVLALLASPEFLIAGGVAVGVTIIAFGGYKIVKKIKARKAGADADGGLAIEHVPGPEADEEADEEADSLREISRIELWRRGIADVEAESAGSTVDAEFVTPAAKRALVAEGRLTEADLKTRDKKKGKKRREGRSEKSVKMRSESGRAEKKKEVSGIRMLFKGHS